MAYKITKQENFVIEGAHGVYEIPALTELSFDGLALIVEIQGEQDVVERWKKIKAFLLAGIPELEREEIPDAKYISIFSAYENHNPDKGES